MRTITFIAILALIAPSLASSSHSGPHLATELGSVPIMHSRTYAARSGSILKGDGAAVIRPVNHLPIWDAHLARRDAYLVDLIARVLDELD